MTLKKKAQFVGREKKVHSEVGDITSVGNFFSLDSNAREIITMGDNVAGERWHPRPSPGEMKILSSRMFRRFSLARFAAIGITMN